jgi:DNA-binding Lrp family transcriptional regulator
MMPSAYVLLNCELGCEAVVIDEIRTLSHVSEVNRVYGSSYDMIIKVSAETTDKLNQIISSKIRRIEKVKAIQTMMVIDGQQVEKSN